MKKYVYAAYDRISQNYEVNVVDFREPRDFIAATRAAARSGKIGHDLDDVEVYCLGVFDNNSGMIEPYARPEFVLKYQEFADLADSFAAKKGKNESGNEQNPVQLQETVIS